MVCAKCGKFNMSQNEVCAFCGEALCKNPGAKELKGFLGEKSAPVMSDETKEDAVIQFESILIEEEEHKETFEISFPEDIDEIEEVSVGGLEEVTLKERVKLRNTALLAVGLGALVSALLIIISLIIFKSVAGKVISNKTSNLIYKNEITYTDSGRV